jgi:hypothetical protein
MLTRDRILAMAREAGFADDGVPVIKLALIDRFAALVAAAEREACATACEDVDYPNHETAGGAITECARVIRARGFP